MCRNKIIELLDLQRKTHKDHARHHPKLYQQGMGLDKHMDHILEALIFTLSGQCVLFNKYYFAYVPVLHKINNLKIMKRRILISTFKLQDRFPHIFIKKGEYDKKPGI